MGGNLISHSCENVMGIPCVDYKEFTEWSRMALMFLQSHYPEHPQTRKFEEYTNSGQRSKFIAQKLLAILKAFNEIKPVIGERNYEKDLEMIFNRFHILARQIKRRHDGRETLSIDDEYDVQDLLNGLLCLFFDDVRPEEWTPSYAGGANRMDFLIKNEEIAIEVKMTRNGLKDKELGEQLLIDIAKYKEHPNCKILYIFVYDSEVYIRNPRGMEADLDKESTDSFRVKTFIRPL